MQLIQHIVHMTMLNSTDNILHKHIENELNIQTCSYVELLLTYMIKFQTGRCSHHEVDAHQRKDTCSQIINALSLINRVKGEQIIVV